MLNGLVFLLSLLVCISLGSYYKRIADYDMKRNYGAGLGVLIACLICGHHVYHTVLMVWGNIIIIKCCNTSYLHQISMAYTWIYLLYLYFNLSSTCYAWWIYQTLALRLVGLAFEVNVAQKNLIKADLKGTSTMRLNLDDKYGTKSDNISAVDIIAYAYFFIGLQKGPYYRFKIFMEHLKIPFGVLGNCRIITEQKLKKALLCSLGYFILRMKYSPDIYNDAEFYKDFGSDFRFLYNIPHLLMYFLHYQSIMMLATSVCTESGFGVYPAKCEPMPGLGPSTRYSLLKLATSAPNVALEQEYNFSMLKCFDNEKLLIGPRMRDTLRSWNMSTRYWFWSNLFSSSFRANKEIKSACSFLAWTLWCGPSIQQILISSTLWVYIHLEKEYCQLYNTEGSMKLPWDIGFSIMRLFCLIYLTPCLVVDDASIALRYFNSMFWVYHIVMLILIIVAFALYKFTRH